jgi:hypothetical protein
MRTAQLVAVAILTLATVACGSSGDGDEPPAELTGVILEISSEGFNEVTSFKLKVDETLYDIYVDPEVTYSFPLSHLNTHFQTSEPVTVELDERDGLLYALTIDDA